MKMDTLAKWIVIIGIVIAVPVLRNAITELEDRQDKAWGEARAERDTLRIAIMEINAKLRVRPDQVMDQIRAMRQEHHEMRQLISPDMREAWHMEQHRKAAPTKVGTR
jgi:hypothetical protein